MFQELNEINSRPAPFQFYTAADLWTDKHISGQMLNYHLDGAVDISSRNRNFIDCSVKWIVSRFNVAENTKIADFGCGPGLYTQRLAERGAIVTGIDFSENSISYAKQAAAQKNLEINYVLMNYLDFDTTDSFDLIIMIMCDFCALGPGQRKTMLSKFRSFLKPGGALLLDVYSLDSFNRREESAAYEFNQMNGFWSSDDYYCFVNTFRYENEKVILDKYTVIEEKRRRTVYNWLQYFSEDSLRDEFEENGFKVKELYSDVAGNPLTRDSSEIAVAAVK